MCECPHDFENTQSFNARSFGKERDFTVPQLDEYGVPQLDETDVPHEVETASLLPRGRGYMGTNGTALCCDTA